ncbi:Aste57867_10493 [Aphanomyces stellatus]|uniref:Aste57867_10493 protein n=1 Tax=Aphanomyces stellatus TaxID=120398 RepID=A0A485KR41_9STRA|nr:hypothetical protein As57867_010453 [Aphanomyces stellatus]VFT87367.1 Aste57867_10493 [Aphanomyces stellatus]
MGNHASSPSHCAISGCTRFAKIQGHCLAHVRHLKPNTPASSSSDHSSHPVSRNKKCLAPLCKSLARRGGHCTRHGGGRKCKVDTCSTNAQTGGFCRVHGGGSKCRQPDCNQFARFQGLCLHHSKA